jgi:hypothetical protein
MSSNSTKRLQTVDVQRDGVAEQRDCYGTDSFALSFLLQV